MKPERDFISSSHAIKKIPTGIIWQGIVMSKQPIAKE